MSLAIQDSKSVYRGHEDFNSGIVVVTWLDTRASEVRVRMSFIGEEWNGGGSR
jgi:hypothetical protein